MEIEKGVSIDGEEAFEFSDALGTQCCLWVTGNIKDLRLDLDTDFAQFSQEDIKVLLPYLQLYAETGQLELQEPISGRPSHKELEQLLEKDEELTEVDKKAVLDMADKLASIHDAKRAQSPLQGGSVDETKFELDKAKKGMAYYMRQCDQYVDQVAELEELVVEWRNVCQVGYSSSQLNKLQEKTIKLLGE